MAHIRKQHRLFRAYFVEELKTTEYRFRLVVKASFGKEEIGVQDVKAILGLHVRVLLFGLAVGHGWSCIGLLVMNQVLDMAFVHRLIHLSLQGCPPVRSIGTCCLG